MTKAANTVVVKKEPVEHVTTLGDVLTIIVAGIALRPEDKATVMGYVEGLDKATAQE